MQLSQNFTTVSVFALLAVWVIAARADDTGHCSYAQQYMGAGPFRVCESPVAADACAVLGRTYENQDAVYSPGSCPVSGLVGTCDKGDSQLLYYEGVPSELQIGCGFQGGNWRKP